MNAYLLERLSGVLDGAEDKQERFAGQIEYSTRMRFVCETLLSRSCTFEAAMFLVPMMASSIISDSNATLLTEVVTSTLKFAEELQGLH